jgi:hypothetical protein
MSSRAEQYAIAPRPFQPTSLAKGGAKADAPIPESLDDALHAVVYESALPAKAIAAAIGVRYGYLAESANPNREDANFQARLVPAITKASNNDALIRFLAHACGGVFVRLNPGVAGDEHTSAVLKQVGDYLHSVAAAQMDGTITRREVRAVRREVEEAIEALLGHVVALERSAVDGGDE